MSEQSLTYPDFYTPDQIDDMGLIQGHQPHASQQHTIGIVGGMGPFAHIEFERLLLSNFRKKFNVLSEQEYPEWIVSSIPNTPDRTKALIHGEASPIPLIVKSLNRISKTDDQEGADFAVIICNTSHAYINEIRTQSPIPVLSIIEETVHTIHSEEQNPIIGLLGTTGLVSSGIYQKYLLNLGIPCYSPLNLQDSPKHNQQCVMDCIYGSQKKGSTNIIGIKENGVQQIHKEIISGVITQMKREYNVSIILTACTELSLLAQDINIPDIKIIDPLNELANRSIETAFSNSPIKQNLHTVNI